MCERERERRKESKIGREGGEERVREKRRQLGSKKRSQDTTDLHRFQLRYNATCCTPFRPNATHCAILLSLFLSLSLALSRSLAAPSGGRLPASLAACWPRIRRPAPSTFCVGVTLSLPLSDSDSYSLSFFLVVFLEPVGCLAAHFI